MPSLNLGDKFIELLKRGCNESFNSEREFREKIVIKLLECLGYEGKYDVRIEFPISAGNTTLRVDYLVGDEYKKFALEVKTPTVSIGVNSDHRNQILSYLNLLKDVKYGVLYNGKKLLIFKKGLEEPIITWSCGDPVLCITYLSKTSYPHILDSKFTNNNPNSKEIRLAKRTVDPLTIKQHRISNFKIIGYFTAFAFLITMISVTKGYNNLFEVLSSIFSISLLALIFYYLRLRYIYRRKWK